MQEEFDVVAVLEVGLGDALVDDVRAGNEIDGAVDIRVVGEQDPALDPDIAGIVRGECRTCNRRRGNRGKKIFAHSNRIPFSRCLAAPEHCLLAKVSAREPANPG